MGDPKNHKTVLALWHSSGKGKSDTLRQVAKIFQKEYPQHKVLTSIPNPIPEKQDFRLVIEIEGKIIGIESQGDPETGLKERLLQLADQWLCSTILCTCRTRGETVHAVESMSSKGFQIIWTSTYQVDDKAREAEANLLKAMHIVDFLKKFKVIID